MSTLDADSIVKMYRDGLSIRKISRRIGVSHEKVRQLLHVRNARLRYQRIFYHAPITELDESVALLLGLHVGDGWLSRDKWGIACHTVNKSMISQILSLVRNVLGVEPIKLGKCAAGKAIMIRSGQPQVLTFFRNHNLPQGRKAGFVRVPEGILESDDETSVKSFLRGLFSTDGCFSFQVDRGPRVEIQVKSKTLRDQFIYLASELGFSFYSYTYLPPRGKNKAPLQVAYMVQTKQARARARY
jgi:intein/homing endonuclease